MNELTRNSERMFGLGIESTAHTFSCSIMEYDIKKKTGKIISEERSVYKAPSGAGIHPREASRHHMDKSPEILKQCLKSANLLPTKLDIISYSAGPGLGPCLRVGAVIARALSSFYCKPLIPVNHALGHVELGTLLTGCNDPLVLLVSGGHTMILAFANKRWRVFGETLDLTIGQLLDQFGRHISLSSPCGNKIEEFATNSSHDYIPLPYIVKGNDVSFSGLLTAAKSHIKKGCDINNLCFSIQETSFAMLTEVVERALSFTQKKQVLIVGGVSANNRLQDMLIQASERQDAKLYSCPLSYSGDNGSQIVWTALCDYQSNHRNIEIENSFINQSWRLDSVDVNWRF